jgi:O-antigen/teichoic acid export membrane protein
MSGLARNALSNIAGRTLTSVATLVFVPLYVRYLGVEVFAFVGLFTVLQAFLTLADVGMGAALTRELARLSASSGTAGAMARLARTMEAVFFVAALLIAGITAAAAPLVAGRWLTLRELTPPEATRVLAVMATALGGVFLANLYHWGLMGVQRQVAANVVGTASAVVRGVGAVMLLAWVAPSGVAFFVWQTVSFVAQAIIARVVLWRHLAPGRSQARVDLAVLRPLLRFSFGMLALSITTVALTQTDKVLLTRLAPMAAFGVYALATTLASAPQVLAQAVFAAVYPRLTQIVAGPGTGNVAASYHRYAQLLSVPVAAGGAVLLLFAWETLWTWTGQPALAEAGAPLLRWMSAGFTLSGISVVPFALLLAHGRPGLSVRINVLATMAMVPALLWSVPRIGVVAGGIAWAAVNVLYIIVFVPLVHRRYLEGATGPWLRLALLRPVGAAVACTGLLRIGVEPPEGRLALAVWLLVVLVLATLTAAYATPAARALIGSILRREARQPMV